MANTVIELRHSYVTGNVPSSLANGEIAINTYDGKLFYRGGVSNTIQTIERYEGPAGLDTEIQFNDSGVLGSDSGLTYNKTTDVLTVVGGAIIDGINVAPQIQFSFNQANAAFIAANSAGVYANGAFAAANAATTTNTTQNNSITAAFTAANSAGVYANGAFVRANNSLNANTNGTITGNLTVTGNITTSNISANVISIKTGGLTPIQLLSDNTVSSFLYTGKSFSVSTQETSATGVHFRPDGTKMFVIGSSGDDINEYALSTPWEITTATFTRVTAALTDTSPQSLRFSADGLSAYVLGDTNDTVYQHTLIEAWNVATLNTTATNTFSVTSQETSPTGLWFKPDGTKMFVVGSSGDDINEYNLSSAGNVATATFVQTGSLASPSGSAADGAPGSVAFNDDGTRLFVSGTNNTEINEYVLSTPYDVSTIRWVSYKYTGFVSTNPTGIFPALSNNFFYIVSSTGDAVYQYATNANSLVANTHNFNVQGNVSLDYDQTIMGQQTVQGAATFLSTISVSSTATFSSTLTGSSTLSLTGATNSVTVIGTSATTGTTRIGGSTQTGEITIGFSTQNQTLNIANGATTSTNTKTVYIGAAGLSGSQTNVIIGSTLTGSRGNTNIYTPNVIITAANTAQTVIRILGGASSISNSTGTLIVNGGIAANGNVFADAVYDGGIEVITFANNAFNTANAAFTAANAATATDTTQNNSITAAFVAANSAGSYANGAFLVANSVAAYSNTVDVTQNTSITAAFTAANSAGVYANGAFAAANAATATDTTQNNSITAAFVAANSAGVYANGAFAAANAATATDATQNTSITAAFVAANSAGVYANGAFAAANSAGSYANSAFLVANSVAAYSNTVDVTQNTSITAAFVAANSAGVYANGAFVRANNSLNSNTGGTITGDVSITGNLTVTGTTTYTNTTTVLIADNIITVNAAINQSAQPTVNAGLEVDRGAQPNSSLLWIETSGKWAANNGNNQYFIAADSAEIYANGAFIAANSAGVYANGAFAAANSAGSYANSAFLIANSVAAYSNTVDATQNTSITAAFIAANSAGVYANGAFVRANNSLNANTGGTVNGNVTFQLANRGTDGITFAGPGNQSIRISPNASGGNNNDIVKSNDIVLIFSSGLGLGNFVIASWNNVSSGFRMGANGNVIITSANTSSTNSNTGALVVTNGVGVTGNLFMSTANNFSTGGTSYRLGWTDAYLHRDASTNFMRFEGSAFVIQTGIFYALGQSVLRGPIHNDTGNNTVLFRTTSPVTIQNSAVSTSNTTGALIVGGGVGVTGNVFADAVYDGGIEVITFANNAFNTANAAFTAANAATATDTTQNNSITAAFVAANSAGSYANGAFLVANSVAAYSNTVDVTQNTSITAAFTAANSAGVYANAAFAKANTAGGASSSGYLANTIIFANSTGVLSNTNNLQFFTSNNTVVVAGSAVATIGDAMAMAIALG